MILGISSYTFSWSVGVDKHRPENPLKELELLDAARDLGVCCLQVGDNLPLHVLSDEQLQRFKIAAQTNSIRVELGARGLNDMNLDTYIALARSLHSPLIRFVTDADTYRPTVGSITDSIKNVVKELEISGITLGIENHDRLKAKELAAIMEAVGSENVGICLDCVNSMGAGEGLDYVTDVLAPYTVNLHIKDFTIERLSHKMGFMITGTPAGKGMTDILRLLKKLDTYKRCQSAVLEQWVPWQKELSSTIQLERRWAEQGIEFLKTLPILKQAIL